MVYLQNTDSFYTFTYYNSYIFLICLLGTGSVQCKSYKNQPVKIIQSIEGNRLVYQGNESLFSHQDCIELNQCRLLAFSLLVKNE